MKAIVLKPFYDAELKELYHENETIEISEEKFNEYVAAGHFLTTGGAGGSGGGGGVSSWNDLTDKPFEEKLILTEIFGSTTVTDVNNQLTSLIPLEVDKEYMVEWDGIEYRCKCLQGNSDGVVGLFLGNAYFLTQNPDMNTGEPFILGTVPNTVSIVVSPSGGTHTFKITAIVADIKKLDNKFIDAEWMAKEEKIEILPKTTVTYGGFLNSATLPQFSLVEGEKYTVIFDYVEYEGVATVGTNSLLIPITTSVGTIGVGIVSGTPMTMAEDETLKGTTHTIAVKQETVTKLPEKYLPEGIGGGGESEVFTVNATMKYVDVPPETDTTYNEIVEAVEAGKRVVAVINCSNGFMFIHANLAFLEVYNERATFIATLPPNVMGNELPLYAEVVMDSNNNVTMTMEEIATATMLGGIENGTY